MPLVFWGAIYVPTQKAKVEKMVELADIKPGEKAADLGAGDGRLVIALAKAGAQAHGYEINPWLVRLARKNIHRERLEGKAFIHWKNFWQEDFSNFDVVTIYGMRHLMRRLEKKLKKELKPKARVVSNSFQFPSWPKSKKEDDICLYNSY